MPHRRNRRAWGREGLNCFFSEGLGFKHQSNFLEHDFIQHIKFRTSGVLFLMFDFHAHEQGRTQGVCQGQSPTLDTRCSTNYVLYTLCNFFMSPVTQLYVPKRWGKKFICNHYTCKIAQPVQCLLPGHRSCALR